MSKDVVAEYIARCNEENRKHADSGEKTTGKKDVVGAYIDRINKERERPAGTDEAGRAA